jgi:hypothetical protein
MMPCDRSAERGVDNRSCMDDLANPGRVRRITCKTLSSIRMHCGRKWSLWAPERIVRTLSYRPGGDSSSVIDVTSAAVHLISSA